MRLLLARHGETDWNAALRIQGKTDIELNDRGREQARNLAERLRDGEPIERLFTSPKKRAYETARIVGKALGLEAEPVEAFTELDFGDWEGHTWDEVAAGWPELFRVYCQDRLRVCPPNGERFQDMLDRTVPALRSLALAGEGTGLVICHSAVIKGLLCRLKGTDFAYIHRDYPLENGQVVEIDPTELFSPQAGHAG